jgi:hypothetical protein
VRRLAAALALLLAATAAAVDVFSPGELAKPHAALEGLGQCTRCHPAGEQLSRARCTECHPDVGDRVARSAGFHGRIPEGERDCWRCHHEHEGRDFALVDWGPGGKERFDHEKTGWSLLGKHRKAQCEKCHDAKYVKEPKVLEAIGKGRRTYLGAPAACDATCHKDPHESRLGPRCDACHTADGWNVLTPAAKADQALHDRTRYPLRGAHAKVPCRSCHGPEAGTEGKWRGIPFAACADCHPDAHVGQLADPRCDRCHDLEGFRPARYGAEEHAKARYPLEGAHRAVACSRCHPKDPRVEARVPAEIVAALARRGRRPHFSKALLAIAGDLGRCETCHADAHGGQLAPKPCTSCHEVSSWSKLKFDHAKDSRYPLEAKHAKAPCASCHRPEPSAGPAPAVRWKPLPLACDACHQDPHAGTLAQRAQGQPDEARCERCHDARSWKETRFKHEPPFTTYRLDGKHAKVACEKCHPAAPDVAGLPARRYRGVPVSCAACHEDPHKGALRAYAPEPPPATLAAAVAAGDTRCEGCHATETWEPKPFLHHDRTGFPLEGAHRRTSCRACHGDDLAAALPRGCVGCHRDPHVGRLGTRCDRCHDEDLGWRASFDADAHRRTNFPLEGRHALLPCEECHGDRLAPGFARPTPACIACHEEDRLRTAGTPLDHVTNDFPPRCQSCHSTWTFEGAFLPAHEACFGIASGRHAGIACFDCHVPASVPPDWISAADWSCSPKTTRCMNCHDSENPDDKLSPARRRR